MKKLFCILIFVHILLVNSKSQRTFSRLGQIHRRPGQFNPNSWKSSRIRSNDIEFKSFKKTFISKINKIIQFLRSERKRLKNLIKKQFTGHYQTQAQILIKKGWATGLIRLRQLKKDLKNAESFEDFFWWEEEIQTIRKIVEERRLDFRELMTNFESFL